MGLWAQIAIVLAVLLATWGIGWLIPAFAYPIGEGLLLLIWGLAPWWALIPLTGIAAMLLFNTFGLNAWPLIAALVMSGLAAIPLGHWWREGRGPVRALIAMPFLIAMPWLLWRLLLSYGPYPTAHLPWLPMGAASLPLLWGAVIWVREYRPKRRSYSLSDAPLAWRGAR